MYSTELFQINLLWITSIISSLMTLILITCSAIDDDNIDHINYSIIDDVNIDHINYSIIDDVNIDHINYSIIEDVILITLIIPLLMT